MSQAWLMMAAMNTCSRPPICTLIQLVWPHEGTLCRVGPWPEVAFERLIVDSWQAYESDEDAIVSAARSISDDAWQQYIEFVPKPQRELLNEFHAGRIAALQVLARCPSLIGDLIEVPALTSFLATHRSLRGDPTARCV